MKPKERKPDIVFQIIDRETDQPVGSYSREYCDEFDFESVEDARNANVHGIFKDKKKYKIAKYRVVYIPLDDDVDGQKTTDTMVKNSTWNKLELAVNIPGAIGALCFYCFGLIWIHLIKQTSKERRLRDWCASAIPLLTGIFWSILFVLAFAYFVTIPRGEFFRHILK